MTKPALLRTRTRGQIKAEVRALTGVLSRAAVDTEPEGAPAADAGTVGELWLYGVVGGWWSGFDAESVSVALRAMDVDHLFVRIHSPGGYAPDGIAIGNLLRNHEAKVTVVVDGLAASAASVIAIAGDEIVMCPGSQMMLHDASTIGWGNAAELRKAADWIDGQSQNYAGVYAYRAGGTAAQWREVMTANGGDGTWYTADDTVAAGLADSVGTRPAVGSPPVAPEDGGGDLDEDAVARIEHDLQLLEACVHPTVRAAWRGEHPKPPSASARGSITTQEGSPAVAFSSEQLTNMRTKLGLPEDADEATIVAALDEALEERAETAPPSIDVPAGSVVVTQAQYDAMSANAALGAQASERLRVQDRESFLDAHRDRFVPAARAAWQKSYDADPTATTEYLTSAAVIVPLDELGHADVATASEDVTESEAYQNWSM